MPNDKPYGVISASQNYDLGSESELYEVEWSNEDGFRVDGEIQVYGLIMRKEAIPGESLDQNAILLESGDYLLLESGDNILLEAA